MSVAQNTYGTCDTSAPKMTFARSVAARRKPAAALPEQGPGKSSPESVPSVSTMFGRRQVLRIVNSSQEGGVLGTLVYNGCLLRKLQVPFQSAGRTDAGNVTKCL